MDQLTSLIGPMRDVEYTLCYYSYYQYSPTIREQNCANNRSIFLIIAIFPNLIRCLQVGRQIIDNNKLMPYIFNIGKYTFNILVATFSFLTNYDINSNKFFYLWLTTAFMSGCYSSFWDVVMDFGFFEEGYIPLRRRLKYSNRYFYISSIYINIVLRFLWVLTVSPEIMASLIRPEFLALILYTLEMFRRGLWNFIRVEYEYFELIDNYQTCFYDELPLYKDRNGLFIVNKHNILNILKFDKHDKIRLQFSNILTSLQKVHITSLDHLRQTKSANKKLTKDLDNYLLEYNKKLINYNLI